MTLWPIVVQMKPSAEQRPAIAERHRDIVVTAGAGAGKTRTLVARYLALLADGVPLRSIVAVTFTRKAAREMRNRVRDEVRRYLESKLDAQEQSRWQQVYTELDAARIHTIHGLCSDILRSHPAEAGIDPRLDVVVDGVDGVLINEAIEQAMTWAADDAQAVALFALLGENRLRDTLARLVARRLDAAPMLAKMPADLAGTWRGALAHARETALADLFDNPAWRDAVRMLDTTAADSPEDRMEIQRRAALGILARATGPASEQWDALAELDGINLTGGSAKAWASKQELADIKDALKELRGLWRERCAALRAQWMPQDEQIAEAMPQLRKLFEIACERYAAAKRERNALDSDDLEEKALALLKGNAQARAYWQSQVRAILVDEFQDTNARQRDLLGCLNGDAGKLFIVGDAKQSIYRFRGADVTVFRAERERIQRHGGASFNLEISYRAHKPLLDALNALMRPVLGEGDDPNRPWVEPFQRLTPYRELPGPGFGSPHVELHLTVGSKKSGAFALAADALAARLAELVEEDGAAIAEDGRQRAIGYGDIAILCRSSTSFGEYEDALERAGIPSLTVAGRGFYARPEIRDLLNALNALADPTDDLALAGLLRSPAFAVSDPALYRIVEQCRDRASLWSALQSTAVQLSGPDAARVAAAVSAIGELHSLAGRISIAGLLKALLDRTQYRAALVRAGQQRAARNVGKLLDDAHASGIVGVGEFIEYISSLRDTGVREGEARSTAEGAVQIMSVHAAKGLEFPIVVLGDITYGARSRDSVCFDPELGILLPLKDDEGVLPAMYQIGKELADDQESAELARLLYVAATRAREKLILSGCIKLNKEGCPAGLEGWLGLVAGDEALGLGELKVTYDAEGAGRFRTDQEVDGCPVAFTLYEPAHASSRDTAECARVLPAQPSLVLPPPLLAPIAESGLAGPRTEREDERPRRVWRVVPAVSRPSAPRWVVGKMVHELIAAWQLPLRADFDKWAAARARSYGVSDARQIADATRECRRLAESFQHHALFNEMSGAQRRLSEVPYSYCTAAGIDNGKIDALYLAGDTWTIVEFKSDELENEGKLFRKLLDDDYMAQAQRYAQAVRHLLGREPRVLLCLLDFCGAVRVESHAELARKFPSAVRAAQPSL